MMVDQSMFRYSFKKYLTIKDSWRREWSCGRRSIIFSWGSK